MYVKSTGSVGAGVAVNVDAVVSVRVDSAGSTYNVTAHLTDGSDVVMSEYTTVAAAQAGLGDWLKAFGEVVV